MNVDAIREFCLEFPQATEKLQWGDALCFKAGGKMFAVLGLDRVRLTFKCTPEIFAELIDREDIRPSPYLGRHNWVTLERLNAVPWRELRELIRHSYEMVSSNALKSKAPKRKAKTKSANKHPKKVSRKIRR